MNTKNKGIVKPKKETLLIDKKEIDSLIKTYQGILSIAINEKYGEVHYQFTIDANCSHLIDFLELGKYKNVSFITV